MEIFNMLAAQNTIIGPRFSTADQISGSATFDIQSAPFIEAQEVLGLSVPDEFWDLDLVSPYLEGTWINEKHLSPKPSFPAAEDLNFSFDIEARSRTNRAQQQQDQHQQHLHKHKQQHQSSGLPRHNSKRRSSRENPYPTATSSGGESDGPSARAKRERFLERNRIAASKCRQKKKEHTQQLQSKYARLAEKKEDLLAEISHLRGEILHLKNEVLKHAQCGDEPIRLHLAQMVKKITASDSVLGVLQPPQASKRIDQQQSEIDTPPSVNGEINFGFDDPMSLDLPSDFKSLEQIRSGSDLGFTTEDSFEDLINV